MSAFMIVILRDLKTGLYFARENLWVGKSEEAAHFGTAEAAGREAWECIAEDVVVVMKYDNPDCELVLNPANWMTARSARAKALFSQAVPKVGGDAAIAATGSESGPALTGWMDAGEN